MENNAEGRVEGQPADTSADVSAEVRRATRLADMRAAADRARSEGERTPASTDVAAGGPPKAESIAGEPSATSGKETGTEASPAGKPAETPEPGKPAETAVAEPGKDAEGGPLPESDPFWKTQLGRRINSMTADLTEQIASLNAKMALLGSTPKAEATPKGPSAEEAELEAELALGEAEPTGKAAADTAGKPAETADDVAKARGQYQLNYLGNFAKEAYTSDPHFAEIKALMLNRDDPDQRFNKTHWGHPDADFDKNFLSAKAHFLEESVRSAAPPKPGAERLKNESPTAALGVGGDTKGTDTRSETKIPKLDAHAQNFVKYLERKGRGHIVEKAFAVDIRGAARSGT